MEKIDTFWKTAIISVSFDLDKSVDGGMEVIREAKKRLCRHHFSFVLVVTINRLLLILYKECVVGFCRLLLIHPVHQKSRVNWTVPSGCTLKIDR